ncbi:hypothetical protein V6B33_00740 [Mangrovibacillus sp. Mu-81]|uniref:hypothetical protein n=1 Tax=Mangrovibacillus sp. Mu-81 TaxID=3121478 RepID=UPI002FE46989
MKKKLSSGEEAFIRGCMKVILKNDTSKEHRLYELRNGVRKYVVHNRPHEKLVYEKGESVKCICIVSSTFITDFHNKAGNDDLTKPWIRRGLISLIRHGEKISYLLYKK